MTVRWRNTLVRINCQDETNLLICQDYAVFAFTSQNRGNGCWQTNLEADNPSGNFEAELVKTAFCQQLAELALTSRICSRSTDVSVLPPVYALGASSGGAFVSLLSLVIPTLSGVCVLISPGIPQVNIPQHTPYTTPHTSRPDAFHRLRQPPQPSNDFVASLLGKDCDGIPPKSCSHSPC